MTIRKTARFTVAPGELDRALAAIGIHVAHTRAGPGTTVYQSWQATERPAEFLHLMEFRDAAAQEAHRSSDPVMALTETLHPWASIRLASTTGCISPRPTRRLSCR